MRSALPQRRACDTSSFDQGGIGYTVTVGRFEDGLPGEVFIDGPKAGSGSQINATDAAVILSIALQHGVPIDVMRHAVSRDSQGQPQGPIGTVLDLLARA